MSEPLNKNTTSFTLKPAVLIHFTAWALRRLPENTVNHRVNYDSSTPSRSLFAGPLMTRP